MASSYTGPHRMPHDHKYLSRKNFETRPTSIPKAKIASHSASSSGSWRDSIFSDDGTPPKLDEKPGKWDSKDEDDKPPKYDGPPPKWDPVPVPVVPERKRRRRCWCWLWLLLVLLALAVIGVVTALVVTRKRSSAPAIVGNSTTSVSTVILVTSQSVTSQTITTGGGTITTVITAAPSIATTTVAPAAPTTTTPAPIQGFDIWRFYNGDIMMVYESHGDIWTKQYQGGSWNTPSLVATNAKPGTSVRIWGWVETDSDYDYDDWGDSSGYDTTTYGLTYWSVYFVDNSNILQEMMMTLPSSDYTTNYGGQLPDMDDCSWSTGYLGSEGYQWQVSDTLFFQNCAWGPLLKSETEAAGYIYLDAAGGGITKLGTSFSEWWVINDLPDAVTQSSKTITCAGRGDQVENLWLINQDGDLEQWWLNASTVGYDDDTALEWSQGIKYSGTSLLPSTSLTTWSTPLSDVIIYQAANTSLMFFTVLGEGATSYISSSPPNNNNNNNNKRTDSSNTTTTATSLLLVPAADSGTNLATGTGATTPPSLATYGNATFDQFYLYYQIGVHIAAEVVVPDPGTGVAAAGGAGGTETDGEEGGSGGSGDGSGDGDGDGDDGINISGAVAVWWGSAGRAVFWAWFVGLGVAGWLVL